MPRYLWEFIKGQKRHVIAFLCIGLLVASLLTRRSFQYGMTIDSLQSALQERRREIFVTSLWILVGIEAILWIVRVIYETLSVKFRGYMNIHARLFGVDHAIEMNYQNLAKLGSGKLLQIVHSGMESYSFLIYRGGTILMEVLVSTVALLVVLSLQHIGFLVFFVLGAIGVVLFQRIAFQRLTTRRNNDLELNESYTKQTAKILMNFILLKIYGIKEQELQTLARIGHRRVNNFVWIKFWFTNIARAANLLLIIAFIVSIWYFGSRYFAGEVGLETVMFIFFLLTFARQHFFRFGLFIAEMAEKLTYIKRYDDIVSAGQQAKRKTGKDIDHIEHDIVYHKINYSYEGQEDLLLDEFELTIPRGQKLAIVGRSGSGKSTLLKLLSRMIEPTAGTITLCRDAITGRPIHQKDISLKNISHESLYQRIGYFYQEPLVFDGTVAENLSLHTQVSHTKLQEVLERIGLENLDLETVIGERGVLLSGGEKQRLALARAFLFDYDVLLLDEPTSNLDAELEQSILLDIFELYKDKTIIVISHRPFVLEYVDRILTLKKGMIVEDSRGC